MTNNEYATQKEKAIKKSKAALATACRIITENADNWDVETVRQFREALDNANHYATIAKDAENVAKQVQKRPMNYDDLLAYVADDEKTWADIIETVRRTLGEGRFSGGRAVKFGVECAVERAARRLARASGTRFCAEAVRRVTWTMSDRYWEKYGYNAVNV